MFKTRGVRSLERAFENVLENGFAVFHDHHWVETRLGKSSSDLKHLRMAGKETIGIGRHLAQNLDRNRGAPKDTSSKVGVGEARVYRIASSKELSPHAVARIGKPTSGLVSVNSSAEVRKRLKKAGSGNGKRIAKGERDLKKSALAGKSFLIKGRLASESVKNFLGSFAFWSAGKKLGRIAV